VRDQSKPPSDLQRKPAAPQAQPAAPPTQLPPPPPLPPPHIITPSSPSSSEAANGTGSSTSSSPCMGVGHRPNTSHPRTGMLKEERHKGSCAAMAAARAQTDIHHPPPVPINQSISRPIDQPIGLPVAPISQSISQSTTQSPSMGKGAARAVRAVLPHRQARGPPSANRTQSAPVPASQPPSYVGLRREQSAHYAPSAHMHPTREPYAPSDYLQPSILHLHASSHVHPSHAHRAIEDDIPVPSARGALYQGTYQGSLSDPSRPHPFSPPRRPLTLHPVSLPLVTLTPCYINPLSSPTLVTAQHVSPKPRLDIQPSPPLMAFSLTSRHLWTSSHRRRTPSDLHPASLLTFVPAQPS